MIAKAWALLRTASHCFALLRTSGAWTVWTSNHSAPPASRLQDWGHQEASARVCSHVELRWIHTFHHVSSRFTLMALHSLLSRSFRVVFEFVSSSWSFCAAGFYFPAGRLYRLHYVTICPKAAGDFELLICTWLRLRYSLGHFDARLVPLRHFLSIEQN
jgi:hypothetical protein